MTMRSLQIAALEAAYRDATLKPSALIEDLFARIDAAADHGIWITLVDRDALRARAAALDGRDPRTLPLYGIPFALKDNIDLAGVPTTAACPAYAYTPPASAAVVQRLMEAGALPIGKTNLDQFATGLVGTRSPYGIVRNAFDRDFISGGSSAGSAVAVALGLVSFSLGTDTAGSGRVPAAFNNLVGLKPTLGRLSTRGVVPACRTLDAVSIFALGAADCARVARVAEGFDAADAQSRRPRASRAPGWLARGPWRFGVPRASQLEFFGDDAYHALFEGSVARLIALGGTPVTIDIAPQLEAARLLYEGPWVAERLIVVADLLRAQPDALHPVTREILAGAAGRTADDAFRAHYRLGDLRRATEALWREIDVLLLPTAPTLYTIEAVLADPVRLNSRLGTYTNFVNLLDLAAVAVPAGFTPRGLPGGVTLIGAAWQDAPLLALAGRLQSAAALPAGATGMPLDPGTGHDWLAGERRIPVVVCGAHLSGLPLNAELTSRGAAFVRADRSAPEYRLFALRGGPPHRPGMVRVDARGAAIEVEVWSLPESGFGSLVASIPAPLGMGKVKLEDGSTLPGFVCESAATGDALDITHHGGWRAYLQSMG